MTQQVIRGSCVWILGWIASTASVAQQAYKWIDRAGTVHYSASPPPNGKFATIDIGQRATVDSASATSAATEPSPSLDEVSARQQKKLCQTATANMAKLRGGQRLTSGTDIDTAKQLDAQQRDQVRTDTQKQIDDYCHGT